MLSSTFRAPPRPISHLPVVLGFWVWASRKKNPWLAWLLVCQESNSSRGLSRFQGLPGAFLRSIVELSARICWLWEGLNACWSALGLCFICSCPGPALGDSLSPPLPAQPILQGQQKEALCVVVLQCGREPLPVSSSAPGPAFTSA